MKDKTPQIKLGNDGHEQAPSIAADGIWTHLRISIVATLVLAVVVCGIYPLVVWGLAQALFHDQANGSLITNKSGQVIGSRLIGQSFSDGKYFHPRPSAAGSGYDPLASGGSNLGPTSSKLLSGTTKPTTLPGATAQDKPLPGPDAVDYDGIKLRVLLYAQENNIDVEASQPLKNFQNEKGEYDQVKLIKAFNDANTPLTIKATKPIPADATTASGSGLDPHISVDNADIQAARVADARKISAIEVKKLIAKNTDIADLGIFGEPGVNVVQLNLALDEKYPVAAPPTTAPSTQPTASAR